MSTDRNEALRLADELDHLDYDDSRRVAAFLREQAVARAIDTFGHNVMAGRAQLQMVRLESRLQSLTSERDRLRAEVERLTDSVAAKAERIDRLGEMVEELSADALRFRAIDWHWEPERDMGPGGRWWASIWVKETPRKNTAVAAIDAARTTHKETE